MGSHKIWALERAITFKKSNVLRVEKTDGGLRPPRLFRVGTAVPGFICAGTLSGRGRKEFWDRTKNGRGISIDLANAAYTKVVVDVEDPDDAIRRLQSP